MLVKQELINKVKDYFDLNEYESKVWLALISKGIASAGEVADISGVPRSRAYDVLESLEKRGFAIVKIGKPVKYIGVKPELILEKLKNNVKKEADDKVSILGKVKETDEFAKLQEIYTGGIEPVRVEDLSAALRGRSNITNHLKEILENATKEVIICTSAEEFNLKFKLFQSTIERLVKGKIKVRVALSGDEKIINELNKKIPVKIKKIKLDAKFFVIDRREIMFYLFKESKEEDVAIWLNSEFFAQTFSALFDKAMGA